MHGESPKQMGAFELGAHEKFDKSSSTWAPFPRHSHPAAAVLSCHLSPLSCQSSVTSTGSFHWQCLGTQTCTSPHLVLQALRKLLGRVLNLSVLEVYFTHTKLKPLLWLSIPGKSIRTKFKGYRRILHNLLCCYIVVLITTVFLPYLHSSYLHLFYSSVLLFLHLHFPPETEVLNQEFEIVHMCFTRTID